MDETSVYKTEQEPDWGALPALHVACALWGPVCGIRMEQKLCWDETALYVRQQAWEREIRAEHTAPLSPVCEDSCMEFFFGFGEDGRYFNFECNPNGCFFLGFGAERPQRARLILRDTAQFDLHTARTEDGWTACYRIPASFLRIFYPELELRSGLRLRANCYKCGDKTPRPHYLAWRPITAPAPDFHRPECFGTLTLA